MILTALELEDIGAFRGTHQIELRPLDGDRPVVLLGGPNGAGKTTILEAVRLCLYGRRALGQRVAEAGYEQRLRQLFHVDHAKNASASMSVALSFEHVQAGVRSVYRVKRAWNRRGQRVTERVAVERDGLALTETDAGRWQDFLYQLLPPPLAELSFFDGERIRDLADDTTGLEMGNAIKALLGLDMIAQLHTDLGLYMARQGGKGDDAFRTQIAELLRDRSRQKPSAERLDRDIRVAQQLAEKTERSLLRIEDELARQGGTAAARRADLRARAEELAERGRLLEEELRELCAGLLPLAVARELTGRCQSALEAERRLEQTRVHDQAAHRLAKHFSQASDDPRWRAEAARLRLSPGQLEGLFNAVALDLSESSKPQVAEIPSLGLRSIDEPLDLLRGARADAARAARLGKQLRKIASDRRATDDELARAPEPARIEPLLAKLRAGHVKLTALHERIADLQTRLAEVASANRMIDNRLRQLYEQAGEVESREHRTVLAARVATALSRFADRLLDARLTEVETSIHASLQELLAAPSVGSVSVDRTSLAVTLSDDAGRQIDRETLSAGQRQIYAMAFMLGLVHTSRRQLPLIIDSPLGRLDALHRRRLAHRYFPHAAQQVIILSTDTEVDGDLWQILEPSISRSYRLEHDASSRTSKLKTGYFSSPPPTFPDVTGVSDVRQEAAAVV